jgi:hypothetical protein
MAQFKNLDDDEYTEEDKWGVQDVINEIEDSPEPEAEESEDFGDLSEVEIRLEEANCLKALLNNSLFEEPLSPIAKRVERKIRAFIHAELKVLLGINTIKPEVKLFSDDELSVLKALAGKALSKFGPPKEVPSVQTTPNYGPGLTVTGTSEPTPTVKKTPSPELPVKVKRTRAPKVKIPAKPVTETAPAKEENVPIKEVTLPNGMVVTTGVATQVRGTGSGAYPTLSPEQQANFYEQQALTSRPSDGILGLAAAAVDRLNALTPEE